MNQSWSIVMMIVFVLSIVYVTFLEKCAVDSHKFSHFALSRLFYMLLVTLILVIIIEPRVLSSADFLRSVKDPWVLLVAILTASSMFLYYYLLSQNKMWKLQLLFPIIMILSIIVAHIFLKEQINKIQWFGIGLAFIGIVIASI